jgi:hypothetical protein
MSISIESRGAVVTESSLWVLDGHGRFRRTPRERTMSAHPLEYADWDDFALAKFVNDARGSFRLRVVPLGRPPGSVGILSGEVLWTNMGLDSRYSDALEGSAAAWFPPSPVPQDADLWPDELPFTAFGQFGPDYLDLRAFDQDVYWVDRNGDPHRIDSMGEEYIRNVRAMLLERAAEFHSVSILRECLQSVGDALCGRVSAGVLVSDLGVGSLQESAPQVWLHSTPLMRRLLKTR